MRTPREVLFDRHRAVTPRLDAVREQAVRALSRHRPAPEAASGCAGWHRWFRAFLPPRPVRWALAVVWLITGLLQGWVAWEVRMNDLAAAAVQRPRLSRAELQERAQLRQRLLEPLQDVLVGGTTPGAEPPSREVEAPEPVSRMMRPGGFCPV
jgi:hypothetical protein